MIISFKCKETKNIYNRFFSKKYSLAIQKIALRKLWMIDAATSFNDLRVPPANRLKKLSGKKKNLYSIHINKQWRICFKWQNHNAHDVEIIDYH